jgi:hypothetical protein
MLFVDDELKADAEFIVKVILENSYSTVIRIVCLSKFDVVDLLKLSNDVNFEFSVIFFL